MTRNYTILYVDDDIDDLYLISEAFETYTDHLTIVHAANGLQALQVLEKMNAEDKLPCLLILDINMPVMDGKEMLKKLRERPQYRDLPVVLFSTSQSPADKQFAKTYEADFFSKPISYSEIKSLVAEFVNKCRLDVKKTA
jgi:CheY-like chemotaxis protein